MGGGLLLDRDAPAVSARAFHAGILDPLEPRADAVLATGGTAGMCLIDSLPLSLPPFSVMEARYCGNSTSSYCVSSALYLASSASNLASFSSSDEVPPEA